MLCAIVTAVFGLSACLTGSSNDSSDWLTGRQLDRQTRLALSGRWADAPLGPLLRQLSDRQRIAIFVDRRVDPSLPVTLTADDLTWEQLLQAIAASHGYGFCRLDDIYYFGPEEVSLSLPDAYTKLKSQLVRRRKELKIDWQKREPVVWPTLSQPRQLLQSLADDRGIELLAAGEISHDLWPGLELPEVSLLQHAILLAVGFDKWIAVSKTGARMKVVDYPRADSGTIVVADVAEAESVAEEMSARFPQLKIRKSGRSGVQVSGQFATMTPAIQALISRQVAIKASSGADRYTVELKGTRGSILATVAQQLNVQLRFESPARPLLEDYIELDIVDATLEEIVQRSLAGTPLTYRLDKSVLAISR